LSLLPCFRREDNLLFLLNNFPRHKAGFLVKEVIFMETICRREQNDQLPSMVAVLAQALSALNNPESKKGKKWPLKGAHCNINTPGIGYEVDANLVRTTALGV